MAKRSLSDNLPTIVGIASVVLLAGFVAVWFYLQYAQRMSREVRYLALPSVAINGSGHSISASFAIKTSGADAGWATKNKQALELVMTQALMELDPKRALAPGGLRTLQNTLRETTNTALHTDKVQEVLVTDFLVSEGDF